MKKIEDKILSISNEKLIQQLENDWSTLETMKEDIEMKITNHNKESIDFEKMITEAEFLFTNPVQKREKSNYELRQLLFRVWFG